MSLFETIDEMHEWFRDADLGIEITYHTKSDPAWQVRFLDVSGSRRERVRARGESIAEAFEAALLAWDDDERTKRLGDRYVDPPCEGLVDDLEADIEKAGVFVSLVYRVHERPRWRASNPNARMTGGIIAAGESDDPADAVAQFSAELAVARRRTTTLA